MELEHVPFLTSEANGFPRFQRCQFKIQLGRHRCGGLLIIITITLEYAAHQLKWSREPSKLLAMYN